MTETIAIARALGTTWVASVSEPVHQLGRRCVLVTTPLSDHERAYLQPLVDQICEIPDPGDEDALVAAVRNTCGEDLISVVSNEDGLIVAAARARERLGVARCPARAFEVSRNKFLTRTTLQAAGLPGPRFALMAGAQEAERVVGAVGLPAVLKPVNGAGSHLVHVVRTSDELVEAYTRAVSRVGHGPLKAMYGRPLEGPNGQDIDPAVTFLVESFLPGEEFSIDLVVRSGRIEHVALADKAIVDDQHFECGFVSPPLDLDPAKEARMRGCVDDAIGAIGLDNSVAHVEVRDDGPGRTSIVEVNAGRPGGQLLAELFAMNTGVNMVAEMVTATSGLPSTRIEPPVPMTLASLTKYAVGTGILSEVRGIDKVEALPDILNVTPTLRVGDRVTDEYEAFAINMVAAGFFDIEDLLETYRQADALLELIVDPDAQHERDERVVRRS